MGVSLRKQPVEDAATLVQCLVDAVEAHGWTDLPDVLEALVDPSSWNAPVLRAGVHTWLSRRNPGPITEAVDFTGNRPLGDYPSMEAWAWEHWNPVAPWRDEVLVELETNA